MCRLFFINSILSLIRQPNTVCIPEKVTFSALRRNWLCSQVQRPLICSELEAPKYPIVLDRVSEKSPASDAALTRTGARALRMSQYF